MNEPLVKTARLRCPVDHAFKTFTMMIDLWWPKNHRRFADSTIMLEPKEHGQLRERAVNGEIFVIGDICAFEPPDRIAFDWHPGKSGAPTQVTISFTQQDEFALVTVVHAEGRSALGPLWEERAALFQRGWDAVLAALSQQVETPHGNDRGETKSQ